MALTRPTMSGVTPEPGVVPLEKRTGSGPALRILNTCFDQLARAVLPG